MLVVLDARPYTLLIKIRGMVEKIFFLSGDLKFQVSAKVLFSCHQRTSMARNAKPQPM